MSTVPESPDMFLKGRAELKIETVRSDDVLFPTLGDCKDLVIPWFGGRLLE